MVGRQKEKSRVLYSETGKIFKGGARCPQERNESNKPITKVKGTSMSYVSRDPNGRGKSIRDQNNVISPGIE